MAQPEKRREQSQGQQHEQHEPKIVYARQGQFAQITLNRPAKLNAIDGEMLDTLERLAAEIDGDSSCRGVMLGAAGGRAFCAGADIKAWSELPPLEMWRYWTRRGHDVFERIERLLQPTVALVDGIAYGGGLELALSCDLLLATESSRFAFPEVSIAAIPGWGGTARLAERVGVSRAKQMIFSGEPVSAAVAADWGLANSVYSDRAAMEQAAAALLERIGRNAPVAVAAVKQLLRTHQQSRFSAGAMESIAGGLTALTQDGAEGIASFREKRAADFQGS